MPRLPVALLLAAIVGSAQNAKPLFNGRDFTGWMWSVNALPPTPSWSVERGLLRTTPGAGTPLYLLTRESFMDFDLAFEWKADAGANSGIKYRIQGYWVGGVAAKLQHDPSGAGRIEPVALEYQIADDERHPDALGGPKHATAAVYEYWPAQKDGPARAGVWHRGRIVARGQHIEHWLDGRKVVDIRLDAPEVQAAFNGSSRKGSSPVLAKHERRDSPIALQFHDGTVWFRNLRIRRL